jgi:hypothetical protein
VLADFLHAASAPGAVPLLSIHGFQYTFEEALARAGELVEFYGDPAGPAPVRLVPLLFTWPSLGHFSPDAYRRDRASATRAGQALGRLLVELADRQATRRRACASSPTAWACSRSATACGPRARRRRVGRTSRRGSCGPRRSRRGTSTTTRSAPVGRSPRSPIWRSRWSPPSSTATRSPSGPAPATGRRAPSRRKALRSTSPCRATSSRSTAPS